MKKLLFALALTLSSGISGLAQENSFFSQTEIGPMLGRVKVWDDSHDLRVNFSLESFNGVKVKPNHALGLLLGINSYPDLKLMPIAFGWRGFKENGKRTSPYAGIDIGYASAWMEKRTANEWSEQWYEGGFMFSPSLGIKRNSKNGKRAYTWSLGYKRQYAFFYDGMKSGTGNLSNIGESSLPPGFISIREESYVFNSLLIKWGIAF